jgi:hypothetical protein
MKGGALIVGGFEGSFIGFESERGKESLEKCVKMR